jgi:hypothetical protein
VPNHDRILNVAVPEIFKKYAVLSAPRGRRPVDDFLGSARRVG